MLFLGHLGIGSRISRFFSRDLPLPWILAGCVLPDVIDKTLYYGFRDIWHWASATRSVGHSGLVLLAIVLFSVFSGSRKGLAVALGVLTHLMLDVAGDGFELFDRSASARAILYPLMGPFNVERRTSAAGHVAQKFRDCYILVAEGVGLLLLLWELRRVRLSLRLFTRRAIRRRSRS